MIYIKNDRTVSITKGFNFWGFVFAWGWLFSRGLWQHSVLVMLFYCPVYFFHSIVMVSITSSIHIPELYYFAPTLILASVHLLIGCKGKQWQQTALLGKRYRSIE